MPAYDNYGYSSAKDFKEGNYSKSTDPNVNRESTFETYRDGKNIGVDNTLKQKSLARRAKEASDAKEQARLKKEAEEVQKALDKGQFYGYGENQTGFQKFKTFNSNLQRKANLDLAKKRAFQKYQDVEKYVSPFDDYTMSGQQMAELRGYTFDDQGNITGYDRDKATAYGYDTSKLGKGIDTLTSNKGTSLEKTRPNLYDVNSYAPGLLGFATDKIRPDTQRTVLNTLGKAAEYNVLGINAPNMTNQQISDEMNRLKNLGRTEDQIKLMEGGGGGGGGGQQYIPYLPPEETEEVADETTFDYRFGTGQKVGRDVTLGYLADGGRVPRNMGGIMNAVPRQGYFLGKIVKGVGKAIGGVADAAGKVLKSDLGKAALAGAAIYYGGGGNLFGLQRAGMSGFSMGNLGSGISGLGKKLLLKDPTGSFTGKNLSLMKMLGLSAVLPFIPGLNKVPENEDIGMAERGGRLIDPLTGEEGTPQSMRANIENAKIEAGGDPVKLAALNQKYNNMLFSNLPYENYGIYAANGGRIGYGLGNLVEKSGVAQPISGAAFKLNRPVKSGDPLGSYYPDPSKMLTASNNGMGGMIANLIKKNPQIFNTATQNNNNSNNYLNTTQNVGVDVRRGSYDFIDENMNGIDDREEMFMSKGGRIARAEGGLMNLGGMEKDYRAEGGFVPIGREEKADDVPARLSVNEFVFTADAVRNAGGGDIDKGAEVMENMMKNLENGGRVSEESQGNTGAQEMFSVSERIGEVI